MKHLLCFILILSSYTITFGQVRQSPTPIIVNLVTPTPFINQQVVATVTPTFTATPRGPVLLEVKESSGSVNVRAEPDPNSERFGSIEFGTQYQVFRQYFLWYEFQYDLSPSGRAWVYGELVDIVGDATEIEVIDTLDDTSALLDPALQFTETALAITIIPGGIETATAGARILSVPTNINEASIEVVDLTPYPTFTYPADIVAIVPTNTNQLTSETTSSQPGQVPPLFPILMLGGFGMIGLLVSSLRG